MQYPLVSKKVLKLDKLLVAEEAVLQRVTSMVDGIVEKLDTLVPQPKDKVLALQAVLAERQEKKYYLEDIAPMIKDASKQLLQPRTSDDALALHGMLGKEKPFELASDKALMESARRAVDQRFGGYRYNGEGHVVRALTHEGVVQLEARLPYKEKHTARSQAKSVEQKLSEESAATAHLQDAIQRISKPLPAEEAVKDAHAVTTHASTQEEVEKPATRIGSVTHASDGRIVHRGKYGKEV